MLLPMNVLGIDAGASSSKWVVLDAQKNVVAQGRTAPISGHLFNPESKAQALEALHSLLNEVKHLSPKAVVAGITGLDAGNPEAGIFAAEISRLLEIPAAKVQIFNDMDLAYRANFAPGEGILVYAGTGSVGYHIRSDGSVVRSGGQGFLIGDEGGGFWIGKTALRKLMWWHDEGMDTSSFPLAQNLYQTIGGNDWPSIRQYVYSGGRQRVAALAPAVGKAAAEGDKSARAILLSAGHELASLAQTLRHRLGSLPIVLCGGALQVSPLIAEGARQKIDLEVRLTSSAETAAQMALEMIHE